MTVDPAHRNRTPAARMPKGQRVESILLAARNLFTQKGFEATTVAEIAGHIGLAEATVYKYFPTKRALLIKVLARWYEELFGDCIRALAETQDPLQRLHLLVHRHLRALRDEPLLCRLMFHEIRSEYDYHGSELHALNRRYTGFLLDVVQAGVAAGVFRADVPTRLLRDMVYGGIEHHCWNHLCGRGSLDVDRLARSITDLACHGINKQ